MYSALIPVTALIHTCRGLGVFIVLWNVGSIIGALTNCRPFSYAWDTYQEGSCGDWRLYYMILGVFNVIIDVAILVLPVPFLMKLQMPISKKLALIGIFSIGWM
jgi:hypothetical protein